MYLMMLIKIDTDIYTYIYIGRDRIGIKGEVKIQVKIGVKNNECMYWME